jgi:uncharacterized membrane protein
MKPGIRKRKKTDITDVVLGAAVTVFAVVFFLKAAVLHLGLGTSAYDLGIFIQNLEILSDPLKAFNTVRGLHPFGDHFQLIQFLTLPFYWLYPSELWLLAIQVLAIASGALLVKQIGVLLLPDCRPAATAVAIAYLINPVVHNPLLWHFHPIVLATPLLLVWVLVYLQQRWRAFWLVFAALLLVREDIVAVTTSFALLVLLHGHRRQAFIIAAVSLGWWCFVSFLAMPYFNGEGYFRHVDGTLGIVRTNLFELEYYRQRLSVNSDTWPYLAYLFAPLLLLPFRSPLWLIPVIPTLFIVLLIGGYATNIGYHYSVYIVPFLFVAALDGISRLSGRSTKLIYLVAGLILLTTTSAYLSGSRLGLKYLERDIAEYEKKADVANMLNYYDEFLGTDTGIAATDFVLPHLAARQNIYLFPNPWKDHFWGIRGERPHHPNRVQYLFLEPAAIDKHYDLIRHLQDAGFFETQFRDGTLWILRRSRPEPTNRSIAITQALNYRIENYYSTQFGIPSLSPPYDVGNAPTLEHLEHPPPPDWVRADPPRSGRADLDLAGSLTEIDNLERYVYLPVTAQKHEQLELFVGSDDTLDMWYRGKKILSRTEPRKAVAGDDILRVHLRPGVNHFYFRVGNFTGAWRLVVEMVPIRKGKR